MTVDVTIIIEDGGALGEGGGSGGIVPMVTDVTPNVGTAAGGTSVTIHGSNFTGAVSATLGGVAVTSFVVVNDTTITCVTGAGTAGASLVAEVANAQQAGTLSGAWNYLPSGYVLHLRADLGVTQSGTVSAWADQSGHGNNFAQATGGAQPTYISAGGSGIGGQADMVYAGGQYLYGSTTDLVTTAMTAYIVTKTSLISFGRAAFGKTYNATEWVIGGGSSSDMRAAVGGNNNALSNGAINDGTPRRYAVVWDQSVSGGLITEYVNGVAQTTTSTFAGTISGVDSNSIGAQVDTNPSTFANGWFGNIPEVILWPAGLGSSDRAVVDAYLSARYGI